ncbi:tyrosine-type recombinase/integrase [Sphingobium yanoikuyae]|uniref:Integrase n=1 Tax=Sphingobium yanoikuyae TaxID=13690 RepID=A0A291MYR3_SPHYA|nr:site-specific integrase [Sphingobium yanoikuyae]ATI80040.1 integrase [Sphingobium yanoikuyae]
MPLQIRPLTASAVEALKPSEGRNRRVMVGGERCDGLHIRLEGKSKVWALRITVEGKRRDMGLGRYNRKAGKPSAEIWLDQLPSSQVAEQITKLDGLSLAEARVVARKLRLHLREHGTLASPASASGRAFAPSRREGAAVKLGTSSKNFRECASAYIAAQQAGWKNAKHRQQWVSTLTTYAFPKIGDVEVDRVDTALIQEVLQQPVAKGKSLWVTKTETASRLRGRIECVLDWARVNGLRDGDNPARWRGHLDKILPAPNKVRRVRHHPALPYQEVGRFMRKLNAQDVVTARALEFGILTAARSQEIRFATWNEIDLQRQVWIIPKDRMKKEKEHRIPLSSLSMELLRSLPRVEGVSYIFPTVRGGALSDAALSKRIKDMHDDEIGSNADGFIDPRQSRVVTVHGFRSSFRDWAGETTSYAREVIEHGLAHGLRDESEAAYQRGDLLDKRRKLMEDWAIFIQAT